MRAINYSNSRPIAFKTKLVSGQQPTKPNLHFNIVHFDWNKKPVPLYFSLTGEDVAKRIKKKAFPKELMQIFTEQELSTTEYVYTTFGYPHPDFVKVDIDLRTAPPDFSKHYYREQLKYYFRKKANKITQRDFIDSLIVWDYSKSQSTENYWLFEKYAIRVMIQEGSKLPSLLLSLETKTKVLKINVLELQKKISPLLIKKVIYNKQLYDYEEIITLNEVDYSKCFPVLNFNLIKALNFPFEQSGKGNKYERYFRKVESFYGKYLKATEFQKVFQISKEGFIKVPEVFISKIKPESNELSYQDGKPGSNFPKRDFPRLRPAERCPYKNVHIFFIYHTDNATEKNLMVDYLQNGKGFFYKGLMDYAGISNFIITEAFVEFHDKSNPFPELNKRFTEYNYTDNAIKFLAIYITPFSKEESARQNPNIYARVKEFLLRRHIVCQAVEPDNIQSKKSDFMWSLTTMSATILAKLDGVPWRLSNTLKTELIIGIGAFVNPVSGVRYISTSVSFDNRGMFNSMDYFMKDETDVLAGAIAHKVREYVTVNGNPSRLIIHLYKVLSADELAPIEKELQELELTKPIPIFIVTINKTESTDIVAFDYNKPQLLMPESGTYIYLGNKKYLLFNNARIGDNHNPHDGYHFPVKLAIDCNKKELLSDTKIVHDLINQVYQFSKMYYKSLSQQNLPVTIIYPELLAQLVALFEHPEIPHFAKDKLWML